MKTTSLTRHCLGMLALAGVAACADETVTGPRAEAPPPLFESRASGPRHVFVLVEEDVPSQDLVDDIRRRGGQIEGRYDAFGVLTVRGLDEEDAVELAGREDVEGVDRDVTVQWVPGFEEVVGEIMEAPATLTDQSGAFYFAQGMQWNMTQIQAPQAWLESPQGAGEVVAVLDTGVDPFHIDLTGKVTATSTSTLTPGSSPCGVIDEEEIYDLDFHGTFVSGLISSNGLGMASVAPDASIMAVKVLNCSGTGSFSDIIDGIAYAAQADADVINMSLGAYFSRRDPGARSLILALQRAVLYATLHGSTVVAAAGNDGVNLDRDGDFINVPSQLLGVVSVGATAPVAQVDFDALASYTNYGFTGVTLMAPGGDLVEGGICGFAPDFRCDLVLSALSSFVAPGPNFYAASGGTSFASPHVAGALAVVESARGSGPASVVCVLRGADDLGSRGFDAFYGLGRLNVVGALGCRGGLHAG